MNKTIFTVLTLAFLSLSTTYGQVGIGTTDPDPSAILEVDVSSLTDKKGFLPPRMNYAQRNVIGNASPAQGLTIYNTDSDCLEWWNDSAWYNACDGRFTGIIPSNTTCEAAIISATPCTADELNNGINGGSLGNKYDDANGGTYSVVEIGGQCWMQENIDVNPTGAPAHSTNGPDTGWYGYYNNTYQAPGEGTLMQWSAAMNSSTAERAQGVCPEGWHVPSDCEWMYLENTLGMNTADQEATNFRASGDVGNELSDFSDGGAGTNNSGFTALPAESRNSFGSFTTDVTANFWSSTESGSGSFTRKVYNINSSVRRSTSVMADSYSVRCLKD